MEASILSRQIENAQKKVEEQNFVARKNVLKYDDVMNRHRGRIYEQRRQVLEGDDMSDQVRSWIDEIVEGTVLQFTQEEYSEEWDLEALTNAMAQLYKTEITAQELLEILGIPFTGPSVAACARCIDKVLAKHELRAAGIPTPDWFAFNETAFRELGAADALGGLEERLGFPLVVKPSRGGSALGIKFAENWFDVPEALVSAFSYDDRLLLERFVDGRELAVSVLGNEPLPVVEAIPQAGDSYDFEARYEIGRTHFVCPADLSPTERAAVTEAAQVVGTLLVLSLAITPAAAASRLSARTPVVIGISIALALIAADGGLVLSLIHSDVKASVFISAISFAFYVLARVGARWILPALSSRRHASGHSGTGGETLPNVHARDPAPGGAGVTSLAISEREDGVG